MLPILWVWNRILCDSKLHFSDFYYTFLYIFGIQVLPTVNHLFESLTCILLYTIQMYTIFSQQLSEGPTSSGEEIQAGRSV